MPQERAFMPRSRSESWSRETHHPCQRWAGRWSDEARIFVHRGARAETTAETQALKHRAQEARLLGTMLSCGGAQSFRVVSSVAESW